MTSLGGDITGSPDAYAANLRGMKWSVGLMTGTVLDGMIDVAAIRTDGRTLEELGPWKLIPYPSEVRALLPDAVSAAREWQFNGSEPPIFREAEIALTRAQADAVAEFLRSAGIRGSEVSVVGFHGQTLLHRAPEPGRVGATRQLGDGELMAQMLGTDVVYDFRTSDMRAGGQGAPLSATYHKALLERLGDAGSNAAVLNLGGVANVTWWDGHETVIACDSGPANAPINDWVSRHSLGDMDRGGALADRGQVDEARLRSLLEHPYFSAPLPKSLDRNGFTADAVNGLNAADGAATLTAFVAAAVGAALDHLPRRPGTLIVCGGGRKNPAIMNALRTRARVTPMSAEDVGWRGDAIEAECFAYLAVRALQGLPISLPSTTGVPRPMTGGRIARASG
jgi:anhydro-N-acetylmuramic acid kinase